MGRRRKCEDEDNGFAEWGGYMEAKKSKLLEQFRDSAANLIEKRTDILKGVAIFVNGHTKPSAEELKILMAEHGGIYHTYQCSATTHIIASNLPNVKINKLGNVPIVKPSWIADSITLGRLLDYGKYLLYTNQSKTQPRLNFEVIGDHPETSKQTKTASDPRFIAEFYNNSRLHLIATLGAEYKQLVNDWREKSDWTFVGLQELIQNKDLKLPSKSATVVMHIDMDCFFVSVGLRSRPELRGNPVAVTHSKGGRSNREGVDRKMEIDLYMKRLPENAEARLDSEFIDNTSSLSEIASCSYEARRCGIKNGMFMGAALKLCPDLKAIPYDFEGYKEVSNTLYRTISEYTLDIEAVSCDEMYVNITPILYKTGMTVSEWAGHLRNLIIERTGCPCSTGFGGNRLQARLATKRAKPNGSFHLKAADVEEYMSEMQLSDLPGVGRATLAKLKGLGLETCGDIKFTSLLLLRKELGSKAGETIFEQARGEDKKPLVYTHERKSVSAEVNYGIRFKTLNEAYNFLKSLAEEVRSRLSDVGMRARCITLKLMVRAEDAPNEAAKFLGHGVCDSLSRSVKLTNPTEDSCVIYREVKCLYDRLEIPYEDLRGVGIQLSRLEKAAALNGFLKKFLGSSPKKRHDKANDSLQNISKLNDPANEINNSEAKLNNSITKMNKLNESEVKNSSNHNVVQNTNSRGRPKGSKNSGKPLPTTANIGNYFKLSQKDRTIDVKKTGNKTRRTQETEKIDLEVLKELPHDIRNEIMKEYGLKSEIAADKSTFYPLDCVPIEKPSSILKTAKFNPFDSLNVEDFKAMLRKWIESTKTPVEIDVSMLSAHLNELATERKIGALFRIIKFLHRHIAMKGDCDWHEMYFKVLNGAQKGMIARYGSPLYAPSDFNCDKHK